MDENKINYSDLALRRGDSPTTINEKLLTEQTEHIFSEDQALEILSEFENNGIQAGMAKQLEILLANKEEYENAIGENQDKKKIIVEKDNPKPENIRGYDEAVAQSREEIRKINEQIATLEKGLEEMDNTQNLETDSPVPEERAPEEPQNPPTPVTPQDEEPRVVDRTPEEKNPNISRTILREIEKSENELERLNSAIEALKAAKKEPTPEPVIAAAPTRRNANLELTPDSSILALPAANKEKSPVLGLPPHVPEERAPEELQNTATPVTPQDEEPRVVDRTPVENNPEISQDEVSHRVPVRVVKKQNEAPHVVPVRRVETRVINEIPSHIARNTEEKSPEEPQNPVTPVTPQDEDTRVAEARPVENNPETTQDTTDSKEWKNNPNDYRTILREIEKSENELRHLNSERDALKAAQGNMPETSYQREMSTIERFLAGEQLKLDQNRNLANNYEAAYSLLKDLDGLTGQPNNSRDAQDREAREEEITAKRKELASHMDELTDTLAAEVRNRVLSERANRNNNVAGLTPEQIISRYAPFAEIYDNNGIKETDPQVLVAEAERQIREREASKEETAHKVAVRRIEPNRVINVIPSRVAGTQEETTPEPVIAAAPTRRNANLELTPDEVIRRYGPAARIYDQAGITGTRAQRLVAAARDSLENQHTNNNGIKETDPQVLVAEAERQIREREASKEETAHKVAVRRIEPNRVINVIPSRVAGAQEETAPEPVIATPPAPERNTAPTSEDQRENTAVSTPAPTNPNDQEAAPLHNRDAQSEYNEALQDFLKIFDDERKETEEKGPFTTMEALNEFHDKYFALKEAANERLVNAKKRLEESRAKNAEQPRTTNTPKSSILALPAANKEKSPVLGLPPHKEPEKQKQPENNETKVKKGLYTIMQELTDGLELTRKMNGKYTASNIRVVKGFKEELKSGNVLYNIVHFVPAVVAMPINFVRKVVNKLTYSMKERENIEKFKDRLSKLSQEDLETIWNEYRGTRVIQERYVGIVNTLLNEKMQEYAYSKVAVLDKKIAGGYQVLFSAMEQVEACDELLKKETNPKKIAVIKQERANILAGKAEMISNLRSQYIEANQILNGGAHGFAEDMKAARTKLSIVGKRFAKDHDFNNELAAKQAEIEKRENAAIANGDNEAALRAFVDGEVLLMGKTEIKKTLFGQQSVGEKYSMPLVDMLNYSDDPFVRDLLRTVAYVGMGISAANALITHGPKSDALLQQNKADTDRVNAANDATIEQVHQAGDTLTGNRDDFITGMQSQTGETSVNISQSLERETLDSNSWYLGTEYNKMDAFNHARYNAMSDAAKAKLEDIATKCYNNQITDMQALEMIKEVANTQHQNLIDIYTEYQPILEQYASTHPFDLHGVQESMQFVLDHPDAVIKMNEGMVESIQVGEELAGLSAEHIAAINSLPSDLATTLFGVATSTAALTYQAASTMNNNVKSGKYGNETTDMIQDYIDSKAKANEAATEEKSSGSGKRR